MLLCSNLQFAHEKGELSFGVSGVKSLTVFADNVIPCVLRAVGVLQVEKELSEVIDAGKVDEIDFFVSNTFFDSEDKVKFVYQKIKNRGRDFHTGTKGHESRLFFRGVGSKKLFEK